MHVWFKWIKLGLPAAALDQNKVWIVDYSKDSQLVSNCDYLLLFSWAQAHSQKLNNIASLFIVITVSGVM